MLTDAEIQAIEARARSACSNLPLTKGEMADLALSALEAVAALREAREALLDRMAAACLRCCPPDGPHTSQCLKARRALGVE